MMTERRFSAVMASVSGAIFVILFIRPGDTFPEILSYFCSGCVLAFLLSEIQK